MDLFSPPGIAAWQARLNQSPSFAEAAQAWAGRLLLIESGGPEPGRSTWVVVGNGCCLEARPGDASDGEGADFVLSATPHAWADLVSARITPATAALMGRLSLLKGDVMALIPHAKAAAALLAAAAGESR
jgi:putative sterol carrier protein